MPVVVEIVAPVETSFAARNPPPVIEDQRQLRVGHRHLARRRPRLNPQAGGVGLGQIDMDRVDLHDLGQRLRLVLRHQIADRDLRNAHSAGDWRADRRPVQLRAGEFQAGLGRAQRRLRLQQRRLRILEGGAAGGRTLQPLRPVEGELGARIIRLGPRPLGLGGGKRDLIGQRVDGEKRRPCLDPRARRVKDGGQRAAHPRPHLRGVLRQGPPGQRDRHRHHAGLRLHITGLCRGLLGAILLNAGLLRRDGKGRRKGQGKDMQQDGAQKGAGHGGQVSGHGHPSGAQRALLGTRFGQSIDEAYTSRPR